MLNYLFGALTAQPAQGAPLFSAITHIARRPDWYVAGEVPDTLDGRFAMVATITALTMIRLEALGEAGNRLSVALTERFVAVMESEHRELGIGDPTLGKTVRKLVGGLARRVDMWRAAVAGERDWADAASDSLPVAAAGAAHCAAALKSWWAEVGSVSLEDLAEGRIA
ncbi:MAG: ubiquinol-cytochrome C chaperone family protein [Sphingomicrobium sp.]